MCELGGQRGVERSPPRVIEMDLHGTGKEVELGEAARWRERVAFKVREKDGSGQEENGRLLWVGVSLLSHSLK